MSKKHIKGKDLAELAIKIIERNGGSIARTVLLDEMKQKVPEEQQAETNLDGRRSWKTQLSSYTSPSLLMEGVIIDKSGGVWRLEKKEQTKPSKQSCREKVATKRNSSSQNPPQSELKGEISGHIIKMSNTGGKRNDGRNLEKIAAALLRGMGYRYVDMTGGRGDGGVDVFACKELTADTPRVKVQAKHFTNEQSIGPGEIRNLKGSVHEGEIGIFITTSSFTKAAKRDAYAEGKRLFLIDLDRLVDLWVEHYSHMSEEDKKLVPLKYALDTEKVKAAAESDSD